MRRLCIVVAIFAVLAAVLALGLPVLLPHEEKSGDIPLFTKPPVTGYVEEDPPRISMQFWGESKGMLIPTEIAVGDSKTLYRSPAKGVTDSLLLQGEVKENGDRFVRLTVDHTLKNDDNAYIAVDMSCRFLPCCAYGTTKDGETVKNWHMAEQGYLQSSFPATEKLVMEFSFDAAKAIVGTEGNDENERFTIARCEEAYRFAYQNVWEAFRVYPKEHSDALRETMAFTLYVTLYGTTESGTVGVMAEAELEIGWFSPFVKQGSEPLAWEGVLPYEWYSVNYTGYVQPE